MTISAARTIPSGCICGKWAVLELLSREGEIAIAKRIEAGREKMIAGICESPLTIRAIMSMAQCAERRRAPAARRHRPRRHLWRRSRTRTMSPRRRRRESVRGSRPRGRAPEEKAHEEEEARRRRMRTVKSATTDDEDDEEAKQMSLSADGKELLPRSWKPSKTSRQPTASCAKVQDQASRDAARTARTVESRPSAPTRSCATTWSSLIKGVHLNNSGSSSWSSSSMSSTSG